MREKRIRQNENRLKEITDSIKQNNIHIMGIPKKEEREKVTRNLFEKIIAENFPNLRKETDIQIQEAQKSSNKINPKQSTPIHTVIKMEKK